MSAPQTNAASARSPIARIPAARPSSGPCSATASRATSTPSGSGGSSWPGAPTTTTGAAAAATARATWTTSGDPSQSRSAFGSPIRVDPPPASTIPPSRFAAGQRFAAGARRRAALLPGARRHALRPRPGRSARRRQERVAAAAPTGREARRGQALRDGWGGTRHTDPTPGPRGRNALGPGAGGLGGVGQRYRHPFHTHASSGARVSHRPDVAMCAKVRALGVRSLHSLSAISTRISTGRAQPAVSRASSASASTWAAATQSSSEADSAGVWLAPVGLRTKSIAAGTCGARMPASCPAYEGRSPAAMPRRSAPAWSACAQIGVERRAVVSRLAAERRLGKPALERSRPGRRSCRPRGRGRRAGTRPARGSSSSSRERSRAGRPCRRRTGAPAPPPTPP